MAEDGRLTMRVSPGGWRLLREVMEREPGVNTTSDAARLLMHHGRLWWEASEAKRRRTLAVLEGLSDTVVPVASLSGVVADPVLGGCPACGRPIVPGVGCACPDPDAKTVAAVEELPAALTDAALGLPDLWVAEPAARRPEDQDTVGQDPA